MTKEQEIELAQIDFEDAVRAEKEAKESVEEAIEWAVKMTNAREKSFEQLQELREDKF